MRSGTGEPVDDGTPTADPSPLSVVPFEGSDAEWDAAAARLGDATFCHLAGWRHVMDGALGHATFRLAAVDGAGTCHGILPAVHVRSRLFGDYLLSMPFVSYGGPLGSPVAEDALVGAAVQLAGRLRVDLLELRARRALSGGLPVSGRKITVLKPLPSTPDELWEHGIRAKVRSQIRRPMKEGMEARFAPDLEAAFYDVFARTMRDLGTPVLPRRFFGALAASFPGEVLFGVVEHRGCAVAAGCGFCCNGEVEITWAGALRDHSRAAPNMLLYWAFMEESIRRGAHTFNFGRCTPGSGTHRFKSQWDGEDHPLPWAQWSPTGVVATPSPDSGKFRLATRVWSRLPLALANAMGPYLARSLP